VIERDGARLIVAGVHDHRASSMEATHTSDPAAALTGAPPAAVRILLAHQPKTLNAARDLPYDLQLSGHTHGGQFFPANILIHLFQPVVAGLHRFGGLQVYVNRGTGWWGPPMRSPARGEVTLLRLTRAP
jgi:predicted MPP superfamily phosphohydrolase